MGKKYDVRTLTLEEFTQLIAEGDDHFNNQIRVTEDGMIYLSQGVTGAEDLDGIAFSLETFCAGCDYVGLEASKDKEHITSIYRAIKSNLESNRHGGYISNW